MSSLATLPATRALKQSPIPRSMIVSAGARESMQLRIAAAGYWPRGGGLLLGQVVVRRLLAEAKALVALLHQRDDVVGRQLVALRLGERDGVRDAGGGATPRTIVASATPVSLRKRRRST